MSKHLLSTLVFILLFSTVRAQLPDLLIKKVDGVFAEYEKTNSPGCALAILKDGKTIYKRGYGMSNLEHGIAINPSSIFHVASVSKQFTAAAIVRLSLEGKLSLNDDVRKYLPEVPDFGHKITFNHLIHHTSGLRDQWDLQRLAGWRSNDLITEGDIMEMLQRQRALNFIPGEDYSYCNTGYTLMGIAVKRITGTSLRNYADSVFFKPLGMYNTHFHSDHAEITPNRTSAYVRDNKGILKINVPVFDNYGATSLFTTVEDLARWDENFYSKKVGSDDFVNAMQLTGSLNNKTPENYASGLIMQTYKGYKTVEHSGADAGYRSNVLRFPDQHFSVVLLANLANINTIALSYKVADLFLADKNVNEQVVDVRTDSAMLRGWAGTYIDLNSKTTIALNYSNGKLVRNLDTLKATSSFMFTDLRSSYTLSGDSTNAKLLLHSLGSNDRTYKKVKNILLTPSQLREYQGEFYSTELDVNYSVYMKDNSLYIKRPRYDEVKLMPLDNDIFLWGTAAFEFSRKKQKINGLYIFTARSRNMFFEKVKAVH